MAVGFGVDVRPLQPVTLVLSGEFDQAGVGIRHPPVGG